MLQVLKEERVQFTLSEWQLLEPGEERTSSRSGATGDCVKMSWLADHMGVRDSKDKRLEAPVMVLSADTFAHLRGFVASQSATSA